MWTPTRGGRAITAMLLPALGLAALAGCSAGPEGTVGVDDTQERAMEYARGQAEVADDAIRQAHVRLADDYRRAAGQVDGVEVLSVEGEASDAGPGVTLVIRLHGVAAQVNSRGEMAGKLDLPVCFRLTYGPGTSPAPPGEVACPTIASPGPTG
ncbi:hypothetical protein AB0J74_15630 [Asanoa sp. NPDC049573]|uniref:hypothetical protein n=1 Tax=Asanoa sp. NPDC049573 TaxID=3155396 RepID=UPI0034332DCB